ncbi:MAG TPA: cation diffusion facilitator family transporter [Nitrososphaeraceae archaeon]|nr:cation diffusion facilitator family transporter [Nitrososphaeraceae archaeon]
MPNDEKTSSRNKVDKGDKNIFQKNGNLAFKEKKRIVITSLIASAILAMLKLIIGFSTNSLGILSESFHSGIDVLAALMTFYAIRTVIKPPDSKFTYGYAKIESLSSLAEILLLFLVAAYIFYEGLERIFVKSIEPDVTVFSFGVMILSIVVDYWRSKTLFKVARKYGSQAIEADALHFKADMISSSIVIVGLCTVLFLGIPNADAYAALIISSMIIYTSLGLGKRTLDVLLDKAPKGINHIVLESISGLEGVNRAHDIRVRNVGATLFIDLHIEVPRTSTHDKAHKIATNVEEKIRKLIPNSDVLVHVDAIESESETLTDIVRLIASETDGIKNVHSIFFSQLPSYSNKQSNKNFHETNVIQGDNDNPMKNEIKNELGLTNNNSKGLLHLYLDVQVDSGLDLRAAHNIIETFESKVRNDIPLIQQITTHIEFETEEIKKIGIEKEVNSSYLSNIRKSCFKIEGVVDCKDIGIVDMDGDQHITLTITIQSLNPSDLSIYDAHQIATDVQQMIMRDTGASKVVVHTEPL